MSFVRRFGWLLTMCMHVFRRRVSRWFLFRQRGVRLSLFVLGTFVCRSGRSIDCESTITLYVNRSNNCFGRTYVLTHRYLTRLVVYLKCGWCMVVGPTANLSNRVARFGLLL